MTMGLQCLKDEVKCSYGHVLADVDIFDLGEDHSGNGCYSENLITYSTCSRLVSLFLITSLVVIVLVCVPILLCTLTKFICLS